MGEGRCGVGLNVHVKGDRDDGVEYVCMHGIHSVDLLYVEEDWRCFVCRDRACDKLLFSRDYEPSGRSLLH